MASKKKKFEGLEVEVTAPRMGRLEQGFYDRKQMTPKQKLEEAIDVGMGFASPMAISRPIDLRKMSKLGQLAERGAFAAGAAPDNLSRKDDENKYAKGGMVKSRGNGIAKRGLTKGRMR